MWSFYSLSSPLPSPQLNVVSVSVRIEMGVNVREKDVAAESYAGREMGNEWEIFITFNTERLIKASRSEPFKNQNPQ
jgi:hypothetical protein